MTINNPGGTALVSGHGELETGDFMLASGTVLLYNSGTINLGSGSTVNQIVGDYIPGTRPNRPDLPLDADYDFMSAVTIMTEENISAP